MSLPHAILGFLAVRPFSGYDLKKAFDSSVRHFWSADQAQIYRALTALGAEGLVTTERVAQQDRPDRKVHHLTDAGRATLAAWLRAPTEAPPRREPFLLKLFFATIVEPAALGALLDAELAAVETDLGALVGVAEAAVPGWRAAENPAALGPALTLWSGVHLGVAYRAWLLALRAAHAAGTLDLAYAVAGIEADVRAR
jgi:PadR family transcriptional regulator AphA